MTDYFTAEQVYQSLKEENAALQKFCHEAQGENETLRMGYAAARLEIESLQARIKTMAEEHADELMVAHLDGRMRAAQPAGEYPALPKPGRRGPAGTGSYFDSFTADQMRAYVDADRAMRAEQPASGLDPELGPMLDFANAGEIAFYDYAVAQHCRATLDILDGKDNGAGACNEPWASVRKRLLSIVELHQSSSAPHGQAPAQAAPVCGSPADLPPLPDPDLRDVGTKPEDIKTFLRGYATEYAKAALASSAPADSVLEDAARLDWLLLHISGAEFRRIGVHYSGNASRADVDAARKQGGV